MVNFPLPPAKKLKIEMILRDLRSRDLVCHLGISPSLAKKLMTGEIAGVSAAMARRINGFFGKRIFPVRGVKKSEKSLQGRLSGAAISTNTPQEGVPAYEKQPPLSN